VREVEVRRDAIVAFSPGSLSLREPAERSSGLAATRRGRGKVSDECSVFHFRPVDASLVVILAEPALLARRGEEVAGRRIFDDPHVAGPMNDVSGNYVVLLLDQEEASLMILRLVRDRVFLDETPAGGLRRHRGAREDRKALEPCLSVGLIDEFRAVHVRVRPPTLASILLVSILWLVVGVLRIDEFSGLLYNAAPIDRSCGITHQIGCLDEAVQFRRVSLFADDIQLSVM
jgi:hypothetical protein